MLVEYESNNMTQTPEQFNKLATKEDVERLEEKFVTKDEFGNRMDAMMEVLDHVVKKLDNFESNQSINQSAHDRMQEVADNHEIRVTKLETKCI